LGALNKKENSKEDSKEICRNYKLPHFELYITLLGNK
jgi:hypothetical protein